MLLFNVDTKGGLVNGSRGKVVGWVERDSYLKELEGSRERLNAEVNEARRRRRPSYSLEANLSAVRQTNSKV